MKKPTTLTIGLLSTLLLITGYLSLRSHLADTAEASYAPEAVALGDSIRKNIEKYDEAKKIADEAQEAMRRADATAKGLDIQLCAQFRITYSRTEKKLIPDDNCPLP